MSMPDLSGPSSRRLRDKVAVVVGAGSTGDGWGIGRATAASFAHAGARVFAVDRDLAAAVRTRDLIRSNGGTCEAAVADATQPAEIERAVAACRAAFGRIDILHNNVGAGRPSGLLTTSHADWRAAIELNLSSAFYASKAVLPTMLEQGAGVLVHVSSIAALRHLGVDNLAYSVAKAGLLHLSRMIAIEHAKTGIRSNCLVVGFVDTPEIRRRTEQRFGRENLDAVTALRAGTVPSGRLGSVWDVARAAVFLASDESAYMTGGEIVLDGAATLRSVDSYLAKASELVAGDQAPTRAGPRAPNKTGRSIARPARKSLGD